MYIVMEIQTNSEGVVSTILNQYEALNLAENKFYQIMAAASISSIPTHTACIFTDQGTLVRTDSYQHIDGETIHNNIIL